MIDRIANIESVGSAAVQAGIEHTEQHLAKILKHAEAAAEKDRVGNYQTTTSRNCSNRHGSR